MSKQLACTCARCSVSALMGPAVLITLGVLFLLPRLGVPYHFGQLWPILLIVIGLVKLAESMASTEGHKGS
jgi:hypothetical protein